MTSRYKSPSATLPRVGARLKLFELAVNGGEGRLIPDSSVQPGLAEVHLSKQLCSFPIVLKTMQQQVQFPPGFIERFCVQHHIRKLSLFGSATRSDFRKDSDVDILAEFYPGKTPSLLDMVDLEIELAKVVGHPVDLRTPADLGRFMRPRILSEAILQYAARG